MNRAEAIPLRGMESAPVHVSPAELAALERRMTFPVLRPGDAGWDEAVELWNGMIPERPAVVVQPTSATEVAACVSFARERGLLLSAKGGGHNIAGTALAEDGLTLDLSRMCRVEVDPSARLARVGPGCRLGDVDRATQAHGLATVLGFVADTGVSGLTLGGGLGYLTRRFGWTVDNLEEVEIVTADGRVRTASRRENADLFWAVRGAGANFGVVTRFTFRLHEVGPVVYGGLVAWPFERAPEVLAAYRELTSAAPRELAVWMVLLRGPAAPFVPPEWQGRRLCAAVVCWSGPPADGPAALARLDALGDPVFDLLHPQPYTELQSTLDPTEPRGAHYYWKTELASELGDGLLDAAREGFAECPLPLGQIGFLHLGGALQEHAPDDGAVGNRDVRFAVGVKGMWQPHEPAADEFQEWVRRAWRRLRPFSSGASYINFQTAEESDDRIRATYGSNFERLLEVKRAWDPDNLFRSNRNLRAAGAAEPSGAPGR